MALAATLPPTAPAGCCRRTTISSIRGTGNIRREPFTLMQELGSAAAVTVGSLAIEGLKTRRKSSDSLPSSVENRSNGLGRASCSAFDVGAHDEEYSAGSFCPLYSDLPSVRFTSSSAVRSAQLRGGRRWEARATATKSENGKFADAAQVFSADAGKDEGAVRVSKTVFGTIVMRQIIFRTQP